MINEWNKLPNDCVNASSVNMFKNRIDRYLISGLHIDEKIVGLSIRQWLPCPLAIWNLLFGMAILLNLVKPHNPATPHHQRMPPHKDVRPTCVHCNKTTDEHRSITCSVCNCKIHLACLKKARYLEGQGWRSQDPPLYLGQLFNSQSVMPCLC